MRRNSACMQTEYARLSPLLGGNSQWVQRETKKNPNSPLARISTSSICWYHCHLRRKPTYTPVFTSYDIANCVLIKKKNRSKNTSLGNDKISSSILKGNCQRKILFLTKIICDSIFFSMDRLIFFAVQGILRTFIYTVYNITFLNVPRSQSSIRKKNWEN